MAIGQEGVSPHVETDRLGKEEAEGLAATVSGVLDNVDRVIVGKRDVIELVLVALLCEGNVLLEDVPGVASPSSPGQWLGLWAAASSASNVRPTCCPRTSPASQFYDQATGRFEFRPGPIMANIVLVDEINRATPRTQSALLEAMQERQVTETWRR